jgi:serine/threonine protein phosphatase PrpC
MEKTEDGFYAQNPFFVVADGVSGAYLPDNGPRVIDRKTGGRMATDAVLAEFAGAKINDSLENVIKKANRYIRRKQSGIPEKNSELLSGTSFSALKIRHEEIDILQAGDCLAFALTKDGKIIATKNQLFLNDTEDRMIVKKLMIKHKGDRNVTWKEYLPMFSATRRQRINDLGDDAGFGLLNGQRKFETCMQKIVIPREKADRLLLVSDGFYYYPESHDEKSLGKRMFELYEKGGLDEILAYNRSKEEIEKSETHIDHGEATAIMIEL